MEKAKTKKYKMNKKKIANQRGSWKTIKGLKWGGWGTELNQAEKGRGGKGKVKKSRGKHTRSTNSHTERVRS